TVALLYRLEVYPVGGENDYIKKFGSTLLGCTFASLAVVALAFGLKISEQFSRVWLFSWAGSATLLIVIEHLFLVRYCVA
ncbi:MAG: hypothetical protein ACREXR_22275, partial [Gammaproteobacteria bacterium]